MKNFIKNRYWLHLAFFLFLGYISIYWADFKDFSIQDKIVGAISLVVVLGGGLGGAIEWMQVKLVRLFQPMADTVDYFDILWSAIGVFLGCVIYYIWQDETLRLISAIMVVLSIIYELTRMSISFGKEYLRRKKLTKKQQQ